MTTIKTASLFIFGLAFSLASGVCARGDSIYTITVNTSSIATQSGYLDLQFNPSNSPQSALAITSAYHGPALNHGSISYSGQAGGDIEQPAGASLLNLPSGYNDYNEGTLADFGASTTFQVTFSGAELTNPSGNHGVTTFAVGFYASDDATPLLTSDPSGDVLELTINANGSITTTSNFAGATALPYAPPTTPEPGSPALIGLGLVAISCFRRFGNRPARRSVTWQGKSRSCCKAITTVTGFGKERL